MARNDDFISSCYDYGIDPDSPTAESELEDAIDSDMRD